MADYSQKDDQWLDQYIAGGANTVSDRNDAIFERERRQALRVQQRIDLLVSEQAKLKHSVDELAKPHWLIWATFVAGAVAAIAAVILLFR
jgi:hypothetical protein